MSKNKDKWINQKKAGIFKEDDKGNIRLTKIDNAVLWNMNISLAVVLRDWLKMFSEKTVCYPYPFTEFDIKGNEIGDEKWKNKISSIADLFNDYILDYCQLTKSSKGRNKIDSFVAEYDSLKVSDEMVDRAIKEERDDFAKEFKVNYMQTYAIQTALRQLGEIWNWLWW